jgi:hypothetical protein
MRAQFDVRAAPAVDFPSWTFVSFVVIAFSIPLPGTIPKKPPHITDFLPPTMLYKARFLNIPRKSFPAAHF